MVPIARLFTTVISASVSQKKKTPQIVRKMFPAETGFPTRWDNQ